MKKQILIALLLNATACTHGTISTSIRGALHAIAGRGAWTAAIGQTAAQWFTTYRIAREAKNYLNEPQIRLLSSITANTAVEAAILANDFGWSKAKITADILLQWFGGAVTELTTMALLSASEPVTKSFETNNPQITRYPIRLLVRYLYMRGLIALDKKINGVDEADIIDLEQAIVEESL